MRFPRIPLRLLGQVRQFFQSRFGMWIADDNIEIVGENGDDFQIRNLPLEEKHVGQLTRLWQELGLLRRSPTSKVERAACPGIR